MQASNKNDAAQVYEGATRATKIGLKDSFKYVLKPFSILVYHYFIEGIKAVQKDGPTKELEKITHYLLPIVFFLSLLRELHLSGIFP